MSWNRLTLEDFHKCSGHMVTVDIETNGLHWWRNQIIGVGLHCPEAQVSGYFPTLDPSSRKEAKEAIQKWSPETIMVAHNAKFELHFLEMDPIQMGISVWDTTVMVHLLDSRYRKGLAEVEKIFLRSSSKRSWVDKSPPKKKNRIWEWPLDLVAPYCINDCVVEHQLAETLIPELKHMGLWRLFLKEMNFLKEVWLTEHVGIDLNIEFLNHALAAMRKDVRDLEQELYDATGQEFNWRSHKQLSKALYEGMGIPKPRNPYADADGVDRSKFADRGMYNSTMTSTFILMEKADHPLGELMSHLRESSKLAKTIEKWIELADENNAIHSTFNITGTRTGRLSSSKPNLQNTPSAVRTRYLQSVYSGDDAIRSEDYNLRQAFRAREGFTFVSVDYSQMEMRMFGLLSKDPFMLKSLEAGRDVHGDIAEKIWGNRDKAHREWAKTISFGLIYGMTAGSLMHRLNISREEALRVQDDYFKTFPTIKTWLQGTIRECKSKGYVRYWSGRIWREESPEHMYKGANAMIQGGCADFLSVVTIRLGKWLRENAPEAHIVNYIHDELMVEVPNDQIDKVRKAMEEIMEAPDVFELPWKTSTGIGDSYGTLEEISGAEY